MTAHEYLSTGCLHGEHAYCQAKTGAVGTKRPAECKFCAAPCTCDCHLPPECCDMPRVWGGTAGWIQHTDEDHHRNRSRMLLSLHERLLTRAGTLAGHVITLRFTASVAFFECSCGINGPLRVHASVARFDGQGHLYRIGRETLQRIRWCGPDPISRIPWVCNGQAPSMWCLIDGALTDGDGQVIGVCDCPCGHGRPA